MLAKDIAAAEEKTHKFYKPHLNERTENGLTIFSFKSSFWDDYFFKQETDKAGLVLHFTAGFLAGGISTLTREGVHVSVSYVVARNGRIYELFPPEYWSFHLGKGTVGGNTNRSSRTIGIEISNIGPLFLKGNTLRYKTNQGFFPYCDLNEIEFFKKGDKPYRKVDYFATFTTEQYASVNALIDNLVAKFSVPRAFIAGDARFETFGSSDDARAYTGIASHVNYRKSGKWDIGPVFEWPLVGAP